MKKQPNPSESTELRRYRVTLEDMLTGEITVRTAILLETAIVLAKQAHLVVEAIIREKPDDHDENRPLLTS